MKPLLPLAIAALSLAPFARAQATDPNDAGPAPVCAVARGPQWVTPTGVLHVLDGATSTVLRWSLATRKPMTPIALNSGGVAFAYVSARNSLVTARTGPGRLTIKSLVDRSPERLIAQLPAGELCGLGATDEHVIACVRNGTEVSYLVYQTATFSLAPVDRKDGVGEIVAPPEPNDPNAPLPAVLPSWDSMAWDGETRTLYAARTQLRFLGALALAVESDGRLGDEVSFAEPNDLNVLRGIETLELLPDKRLLAPDGLIVRTTPSFEIEAAPAVPGEAFAIGADVFQLGEAVTRGCELTTTDGVLSDDSRLVTGPVRSAFWNGKAFLRIGSGATTTLRQLRAGSGDLDGDSSRDELDVFPLDPVTKRDWDHDGVADGEDAAPTKASDWLDSDGDKVADNADAFPEDPTESKDTDGDGVGDKTDAFPLDETRDTDSDSDGVDDADDFAPFDPLEQADLDENGTGDNADADPAFGSIAGAFEVQVRRRVGLVGFEPEDTESSQLFILYGNGRFELCETGDAPRSCSLSGNFERKDRAGKKLKLLFDVGTLSQLENEFAFAASGLVALTTPDPRLSSPLFFVPKSVTPTGSATIGKKGITLELRARFVYARKPKFGPGWSGALTYRAKGPAVDSLP